MTSVRMNFDWDMTKQPLVVFIPNFGRGQYIRDTVHQFQSLGNPLIIIGNDGIYDDFSDLAKYNVRHFTIDRGPSPNPRNGCFIRNYYIKRSLSDISLFKDPETVIETNNSLHTLWSIFKSDDHSYIWRPRYNREMFKEESDAYRQYRSKHCLAYSQANDIEYYRLHWAFAVNTELLRTLGGYNEEFVLYGPEDRDLFIRLRNYGIPQVLDASSTVYHLYHDMEWNVYDSVRQMEKVFQNQNYDTSIANQGKDWGNG